MRRRGLETWQKWVIAGLAIAAWAAAYHGLPYRSGLDGPFETAPFGFEPAGLPVMSETELKVLGVTVFVLEARHNLGPAPGTVFVLRNRDGKIRWTRLGAPELGRIQLAATDARWFPPGGWVVNIKPEHTGSGELYVSPVGSFRFFFHNW